MKHISIFASGRGSNANKIIEHFQGHPTISVGLIISNKPEAGVLELGRQHGITTRVITRKSLQDPDIVLPVLAEARTSLIVLAGFLLLMPPYLVDKYASRMINIHPALLPKYGGKGMYGMHVHDAVVQARERVSGITIHYVNSRYDEGAIIFQAKVLLEASDSPKAVAQKVLHLEHLYYPRVIESLLI